MRKVLAAVAFVVAAITTVAITDAQSASIGTRGSVAANDQKVTLYPLNGSGTTPGGVISTCSFDVEGTFSGTLNVMGQTVLGVPQAWPIVDSSGASAGTAITAPGIYRAVCNSLQYIWVQGASWSSGTANVYAFGSPATLAKIGGGGGGGGVATVSGNSPIGVDSTDPANPVVNCFTCLTASQNITFTGHNTFTGSPTAFSGGEVDFTSNVRVNGSGFLYVGDDGNGAGLVVGCTSGTPGCGSSPAVAQFHGIVEMTSATSGASPSNPVQFDGNTTSWQAYSDATDHFNVAAWDGSTLTPAYYLDGVSGIFIPPSCTATAISDCGSRGGYNVSYSYWDGSAAQTTTYGFKVNVANETLDLVANDTGSPGEIRILGFNESALADGCMQLTSSIVQSTGAPCIDLGGANVFTQTNTFNGASTIIGQQCGTANCDSQTLYFQYRDAVAALGQWSIHAQGGTDNLFIQNSPGGGALIVSPNGDGEVSGHFKAGQGISAGFPICSDNSSGFLTSTCGNSGDLTCSLSSSTSCTATVHVGQDVAAVHCTASYNDATTVAIISLAPTLVAISTSGGYILTVTATATAPLTGTVGLSYVCG
jgi:hypothetical protein